MTILSDNFITLVLQNTLNDNTKFQFYLSEIKKSTKWRSFSQFIFHSCSVVCVFCNIERATLFLFGSVNNLLMQNTVNDNCYQGNNSTLFSAYILRNRISNFKLINFEKLLTINKLEKEVFNA